MFLAMAVLSNTGRSVFNRIASQFRNRPGLPQNTFSNLNLGAYAPSDPNRSQPDRGISCMMAGVTNRGHHKASSLALTAFARIVTASKPMVNASLKNRQHATPKRLADFGICKI
jgi:hypothetical protein